MLIGLRRRRLVTSDSRAHIAQYQPLSAFMILFTPEIFIMFLFCSLLYMCFYINL